MTNLLTVLPEFDIRPYTHILPSLEKALVSTADLLSLEALDVAKRAQVPAGEVKKLADALLEALQDGLGLANHRNETDQVTSGSNGRLRHSQECGFISTLDDSLDSQLRGGLAAGYLTEIVGER